MLYNYSQTGSVLKPTCSEGEVLEIASDGTQKCVTKLEWTTSRLLSPYWAVPGVSLIGYFFWRKSKKATTESRTHPDASSRSAGAIASRPISRLSNLPDADLDCEDGS